MTTDLVTQQEEEVLDTSEITPMSVQQRVAQNDQLLRSIGPIIKKDHVIMQQGKSYVCVAGGTAIANALGFTISTDEVVAHNDDDGKYYSAVASLIDSHTGNTVGRATGYVGMDEPRWSKAPLYARRSMTSTRAVARLCRQNFGHFYVALGHSDTPLEELPDVASFNRDAPIDSPTPAKSYDDPVGPAPDGVQVLHVTDVEEWSKEGASWTKYTVTFAEGYKATTFSETLANVASTAKDSGCAVDVEFKINTKFNTYDLASISTTEVETPMPTVDDIPFDKVNKP